MKTLNNTDKTVSSHKRNTAGLEKARQERREKCNAQVDEAIKTLIKEHKSISFNSVAELAGVSKKYLYDNHYDRINMLRERQAGSPAKKVKHKTSDASKDVLLAAQKKRIKELEAEVARLKKIIERKYAEEYEKL